MNSLMISIEPLLPTLTVDLIDQGTQATINVQPVGEGAINVDQAKSDLVLELVQLNLIQGTGTPLWASTNW